MSGYYDGLNQKLLNALPPAQRVLEFGCANGRLGQRYKELHPAAHWIGVDINGTALGEAREHLDGVLQLDLDRDDIRPAGDHFDLIVMGDLLEHLKQPDVFLATLAGVCTGDARLVCCIPNVSHASVVERLLIGDFSYDDDGLLDRTHLRFFTPSSIVKNFLDAGWLAGIVDGYTVVSSKTHFRAGLIEAAAAAGIAPAQTARAIDTYQFIVGAQRVPLETGEPVPLFSVIVAVNNELQFGLNLARSPGIAEVGAPVLAVRGAQSAAEAFESAAPSVVTPWILYAHQDVYVPRGSGFAINRQLRDIAAEDAATAAIGFAGLAVDDDERFFEAGCVVDRTALFDHPPSDRGITLDEFAVLLHRDSRLKIDPALGWHLWATDLSLQAWSLERAARIWRLPILHNHFAIEGDGLPPAYHASAAALLRKWPNRSVIPTLCGFLTRDRGVVMSAADVTAFR